MSFVYPRFSARPVTLSILDELAPGFDASIDATAQMFLTLFVDDTGPGGGGLAARMGPMAVAVSREIGGTGAQAIAMTAIELFLAPQDYTLGAPSLDSTLLVELREGGVVRVSRPLEPMLVAGSESTRWEFVLTDDEKASIGTWNNLQLWLTADGGQRAIRVTRFVMFAP